jgi:hypothetical protein
VPTILCMSGERVEGLLTKNILKAVNGKECPLTESEGRTCSVCTSFARLITAGPATVTDHSIEDHTLFISRCLFLPVTVQSHILSMRCQ